MSFKAVSASVNFPQLEEEILKYWKKNRIFEKSIETRPAEKRWTFLDGPPFVTGTPHYGSLLSSIPKDLFGRFYTMKGYRVRRVWGWDGHGLPVENKVEGKLGIKSKREIEGKVGVDMFIKECLEYVNQISGEWEWYVDHIGRWVDFKNAYKTWDLPYMESVMWVFSQIYKKGLIYKGFKVILYCPHCSTPISTFEVAMDTDNYQDITEPANIYKYKLKDEDQTYFLAWSTTPWNKIATPALAVNPKLDYVKVEQGEECYILAKTTLKMLHPELIYKVLEEFKGSNLVGKKFDLHYDFYKVDQGKKVGVIIGGEFVTADEGTGIVTIAAYGEEDLEVMQKENIQVVLHLDEEGKVLPEVPIFGGMYYLDANEAVNQDLKGRGLLYDGKLFTHSVPHCWRCQTRLYYAPKDAWYIDIQKLKSQLFRNNELINWFPKHFKHGRFAKSIEAAPDWNISRNRYWGSPVPVWECTCGERFVPQSIQELEDKSGSKIKDLHKPFIDEVFVRCEKCGEQIRRVPDVLDSWVEAGSASFAERHFPFNKSEKFEDFFPPDFIAEYTGQIRAWFYVLHVIGTALYGSPAFKNVLVEGVMLGTDGRKMSKNYGNYPDPRDLIQKYGGDALRVYLLTSPVMRGEDVNFSDSGVPDATKGFLLILWNCYKFFTDYANLSGWSCGLTPVEITDRLTVLDRWILSRLTRLTLRVNSSLEGYDTYNGLRLIQDFVVSDLSTWYIRRSRDRVGPLSNSEDQSVFLSTTYGVLVTISKLLAPFLPFISEEIFRNLTGEESVHLQDYPGGDKSLLDEDLEKEMVIVRKHAELAHAERKERGIPLRQPLFSLSTTYSGPLKFGTEQVLLQEVNVKRINYVTPSSADFKVVLDTDITPELKNEGAARELIRSIQQLRKESGLTLKDQIKVVTPDIPEDEELKLLVLKQTNSVKIIKGSSLKIEVV